MVPSSVFSTRDLALPSGVSSPENADVAPSWWASGWGSHRAAPPKGKRSREVAPLGGHAIEPHRFREGTGASNFHDPKDA